MIGRVRNFVYDHYRDWYGWDTTNITVDAAIGIGLLVGGAVTVWVIVLLAS